MIDCEFWLMHTTLKARMAPDILFLFECMPQQLITKKCQLAIMLCFQLCLAQKKISIVYS